MVGNAGREREREGVNERIPWVDHPNEHVHVNRVTFSPVSRTTGTGAYTENTITRRTYLVSSDVWIRNNNERWTRLF